MKKYYFLFFAINLVLVSMIVSKDEVHLREIQPLGFNDYLFVLIAAVVTALVPIGISYLISRFWKRKPIFTAASTFAICYVIPVTVIELVKSVC